MDSRMQQRLDDLEQQADRLAFENETLRRRVEALEVQLDVSVDDADAGGLMSIGGGKDASMQKSISDQPGRIEEAVAQLEDQASVLSVDVDALAGLADMFAARLGLPRFIDGEELEAWAHRVYEATQSGEVIKW